MGSIEESDPFSLDTKSAKQLLSPLHTSFNTMFYTAVFACPVPATYDRYAIGAAFKDLEHVENINSAGTVNRYCTNILRRIETMDPHMMGT